MQPNEHPEIAELADSEIRPPNNPTHSTNLTPAIYPKALQNIIGVNRVNCAGCKWNFENRKTRHSDSAKTAKMGFVSFGTMHLGAFCKNISSSDREALPPHHPHRPRQLRRAYWSFLPRGIGPFCTGSGKLSAREFRGSFIKVGQESCRYWPRDAEDCGRESVAVVGIQPVILPISGSLLDSTVCRYSWSNSSNLGHLSCHYRVAAS